MLNPIGLRGHLTPCLWFTGFLQDIRAGAVGVASVLIALMCFTGTAFVSDHLLLVRHRNALRGGTEAASIAATQRMARLDADLTREQLVQALEPLAKRYVLANVPDGARELVEDTLELTLTPNRDTGVVGVEARADFGGAMVGRYLWGKLIDKTRASSGAERVVAPVNLVLAIDVTGSMRNSIRIRGGGPSRMTVVRNAAQVLIRSLYDQEGEVGHISVGLVPWNTTVNIGATRRSWVNDLGQGHKIIPPGFDPWQGCIEHRTGDLDLSLVLPEGSPFTSWFWPSSLEYRPADRAALATEIGTAVRGENDWSPASPHQGYDDSPHYGCPRNEILPLTANRKTAEQAVADLRYWRGGGTMMHLGIVWGRRLLAREWRNAWGLTEESEAGRRVLVLLSDGLNNANDHLHTYPGQYRHNGVLLRGDYTTHYTGYGRVGVGSIEEGYRTGTRFDGVADDSGARDVLNSIFLEACEMAKDEGITVFTVSAVPHGHSIEQALRERLVACASSQDHAFVENSEPARMETAFRDIGRMVQGIRRTR